MSGIHDRRGDRRRLGATQASRNYDYVYDPNYIISGARDHVKVTMKAQTDVRHIKCVPLFENMFSDLVHHPRFDTKLDGVDPLPSFISREWQNYETVARETLITCRRIHRDAAACFEAGHQLVAHHFKYFDRPITPNICHKMPPTHFLALVKFAPGYKSEEYRYQMGVGAEPASEVRGSARKTIARDASTQTVYRDGETQTTPYTPAYAVSPGTQPEILELATLTSKKGLPAGLQEIFMIERTRANRALELTVPPGSARKDKWRVMQAILEANERCHWIVREKEIEKLQKAKLEVLIRLLKKREKRLSERNKRRFEAIWAEKLEQKNAVMNKKLAQIKHDFERGQRKLTVASNKRLQLRFKRRDIGQEYVDFGSQVYAPLTRVGHFLDSCADQYKVQNKYLSTYKGLCELENSTSKCMLNVCTEKPVRITTTKSGYLKHKYRYEQLLIDMYETIKARRKPNRSSLAPIPSSIMQKIVKPVPRRNTPMIGMYQTEEEERKELAVSLLQILLRGRRVQTEMFEGLDRMKELVSELRSIHSVQQDKKEYCEAEKKALHGLIAKCQEAEHLDYLVDSELNELDSESLAKLLDFLSKELIKLQEEQRLGALSVLIERQRRIREAEEAGQRQLEERRRREEDEIFKQAVKVHQVSIDTYLEDVILTSLNRCADKEARSEVQQLAQNIDAVVYELEHRRTELESDAIVAELVNSFLLPEVQKEISREKVRQHQRRFLKAAHKEIHNASSPWPENKPEDVLVEDVSSNTKLEDESVEDVSSNTKLEDEESVEDVASDEADD